jgi:hypothetical protein
MLPKPERLPPAIRKLMWFIVLWAAGVGTVAVVAYGIRAMVL